jgi:hypothetical protein
VEHLCLCHGAPPAVRTGSWPLYLGVICPYMATICPYIGKLCPNVSVMARCQLLEQVRIRCAYVRGCDFFFCLQLRMGNHQMCIFQHHVTICPHVFLDILHGYPYVLAGQKKKEIRVDVICHNMPVIPVSRHNKPINGHILGP